MALAAAWLCWRLSGYTTACQDDIAVGVHIRGSVHMLNEEAKERGVASSFFL